MESNERITRALSRIVLDRPWFACLVMRLDVVIDTVAKYRTACTDGKRITIDPVFLEEITDDELVFVLVHEALHPGLLFWSRRCGRDLKKWNAAHDYAINLIAVDDGLTAPKGVLLDHKYAGMSAEEIYSILPDGIPVWDMIDGDGNESGEWKDAMAESQAIARAFGHTNGSLDREWKNILAPRISWEEILRRQISHHQHQSDYSWRRLNPRALAVGCITPGMTGESYGDIAVCIDTSGSISHEQLSRAIGVVRDATNYCAMTVIYSDAAISRIDHVEQGECYTPKEDLKGGGGTDFRPAITEAAKHAESCIYVSADCAGTFPDFSPIPLIWLAESGAVTPPIGELIVMEV